MFAAVLVGGVATDRSGVAGAQGEVDPGSARTQSALVRVGPSRGALSLSPQVGLVLTDYLGTRGRGDVRTTDFAALADSIPDEVVAASPTVKVESTDEGSEAGQSAAVGGTPPGFPLTLAGAELNASAGDAPFGQGSFSVGDVDLGVGSMAGMEVSGFSGYVDGAVREARARVYIGRLELAEGEVVLRGLEWNVITRSGGATSNSATFAIEGMTVAGQNFAPPPGSEDPLRDVLDAIQPVLGPVGLQVTLPESRIEQGVVELTPLRIRVADSELGLVVNPILDLLQPVRDPLVAALREGSEDVDAAILLTDVALGVLAGGSTLDLELGGATAFTQAPSDRFSFGTVGSVPAPAPPPTSASPTPTAGGSAGSGSTAATTPAVSVTADTPTQNNAAGISNEVALDDVRPIGRRGGPLFWIGLGGLLLIAASAGRDYLLVRNGFRHQRVA
ncbi:MAG: hypothetical protein OSA99_17470 [Acidimicrobiales bacterium]|nr:hypothetical protein [Acidimicrobiales bacterium]